jgi:hypothetical protein
MFPSSSDGRERETPNLLDPLERGCLFLLCSQCNVLVYTDMEFCQDLILPNLTNSMELSTTREATRC